MKIGYSIRVDVESKASQFKRKLFRCLHIVTSKSFRIVLSDTTYREVQTQLDVMKYSIEIGLGNYYEDWKFY